jgi:uncharacterized protein YdhG (YjbR/CyaY superfamily)
MPKIAFASVDDYIAVQPQAVQVLLETVRNGIRKAVPRAEESISYNIPTYKLDGRPMIYFAAWKKHFSIYPASAALVEEFKEELAAYEVEKGTIRFPLTAPPPVKLIARIAKFRAREFES